MFPLKDGNYMVRPPVVQIYIGNNEKNPTVRNVLTYPLKMSEDLKESAKSISNDTYFEHSLSFNETNENKNEKKGCFNIKRYIVTSVSIKDLENTNGWNYNVNKDIPGTKRGFIVTLSLSETTRNFLDLVPDFKAYYDVWKPRSDTTSSILLKEKEYADEKFSYKSQNTLSEDLEKLKSNRQSDLNDAKKQKKAQEKTLRGLTKDVKKNQQELDKINNDIAKLNAGDLDYMINNGFKLDENGSSATWKIEQMTKLKSAQISLSNKIQIDNNEMDRLNDSIGSLSNDIRGFETNIRNISSAMKTLTLGAY